MKASIQSSYHTRKKVAIRKCCLQMKRKTVCREGCRAAPVFRPAPHLSLTVYISDLAFCVSTSLLSLCCDQCIISRYQYASWNYHCVVIVFVAVNHQAPARALEPQLYSSWKIGSKLTEDNYTFWARSMIRAMENHGVINAIESSLEPQDRRALT